MRLFLFVCLCTISLSAWSDNHQQLIDKQINQTYVEFIRAFDQLDAKPIMKLYSPTARYIPESEQAKIAVGPTEIYAQFEKFFKRIRHHNGKIKADFRVQDRQYNIGAINDIGYYLIRYYPEKSTGEPVVEFAGKFVTSYSQNKQRQWRITIDTNSKSAPRYYFEASPIKNLYYGNQFKPLE